LTLTGRPRVPRWTPCKRRTFVQRLRALGFDGPFTGTRPQFMVYGQHRLAILPTPVYSVPQLRMMLREVEAIVGRAIDLEEWRNL
jgi:hypothetical protein